ncbi:MAG: hypothetical protein WD512_09545, partial [Candidatus Paceibacterota bacterium]
YNDSTYSNLTQATTTASTGGYDADYQAVLDYATANSIPLPTTAESDANNQLLIDYKATGAWAKDDCLFKFKGSADSAFKLICWKRRIQAIGYGSLAWSVDGVKGNASNAYIDPLYNPRTLTGKYKVNDASIGFKTFDVGTVGTRTIAGAYVNGSDDGYSLIIPNSSDSYMALNRVTTSTRQSNYASTEYTQIDRLPNNDSNLNNVFKFNIAPDSKVASAFFILARNNNGNPDVFGDQGISFIRFGGDTSSEYSAVKTVIDSI